MRKRCASRRTTLGNAVSPLDEFIKGQFREIIDDSTAEAERIRRVILCSGKVYYDLQKYRHEHNVADVAIVRIEQLYPLAEDKLVRALQR